MFLAEFTKKKKEEKRVTLRDRIVGTTNAGKAFRVGALASGAGLAALAYNKRGALKNMANNPKDFFTRPAGKDNQEMLWQKYDKKTNKWVDDRKRSKTEAKQNPSFLSSGRNLNWGRVGKTAGITGTALAIPTGAAYIAGSKKEKEDIERRTNKVVGGVKSTAKDLRTWINTLHRVSR